jgi:hypothetical protein
VGYVVFLKLKVLMEGWVMFFPICPTLHAHDNIFVIQESRCIVYVDILYLNSDMNEAKLKEKAQLFHDSFLTKVLVPHI